MTPLVWKWRNNSFPKFQWHTTIMVDVYSYKQHLLVFLNSWKKPFLHFDWFKPRTVSVICNYSLSRATTLYQEPIKNNNYFKTKSVIDETVLKYLFGKKGCCCIHSLQRVIICYKTTIWFSAILYSTQNNNHLVWRRHFRLRS